MYSNLHILGTEVPLKGIIIFWGFGIKQSETSCSNYLNVDFYKLSLLCFFFTGH